jgi:hypothetical protein
MRLRGHIASTRALKKTAYELLRQLHDLENRGKRRQKTLANKSGDQPFLLLMLLQLSELYHRGLPSLDLSNDAGAAISMKTYVEQFDGFVELVRHNVLTGRPLERHCVSLLLTKHTRAFNQMLEAGIDYPIDVDCWTKAVWAAVGAVGNNLRVRH